MTDCGFLDTLHPYKTRGFSRDSKIKAVNLKQTISMKTHLTIIRWSEVKSLSRVRLFETPWTVAYWAPLSMGFSRKEYWSGEKSLFRKRLSQLDVHMKPDPYHTPISTPEGMHNYMQEKNNTISIRHSWRMFLWSWSREKFFVKGYKKH